MVSDVEAEAACAALQQQISHHFSVPWGITCYVEFFPSGKKVSSKLWQLVIADTSDTAGALGYHEEQNDLPIGFVFVKTDIEAGIAWTTTLSHEALELLADPYIGSWAQMSPGYWTAWEVADAVENNSYDINGIAMSDFLLPAWFGAGGSKFSYLGSVSAPFTLAPGGYMGVIKPDGTYAQVTARKDPGQYAHREIAPFFSRRHRRILARR